MHSITGVDFFNILDGRSNGMELLNFFDEALQLERENEARFLNVGIVLLWIIVVFTTLDLWNMFNFAGHAWGFRAWTEAGFCM